VAPAVTPLHTPTAEGVAALVLAVDDHPSNRNLLARQIRALGLRVQTAADGQEALAVWHNDGITLVVTDCNMPQMDGFALSRAIREIEVKDGRPRTPIIAWTANVLPASVTLCRAADMDDILTKPAGLAALKETLSRWLPSAAAVTPSLKTSQTRDREPIQTAPLELAELDQIAANPAERAEILLDFMTQTRSDVAGLRAALSMQNLPDCARIAHRMKGSSRMVGAQELAAACDAIERSPGQSSPEAQMGAIDRAMERMETHLAQTIRASEEQT
jgi:two-component system, NarL family, sensor histidine kinase EvgS